MIPRDLLEDALASREATVRMEILTDDTGSKQAGAERAKDLLFLLLRAAAALHFRPHAQCEGAHLPMENLERPTEPFEHQVTWYKEFRQHPF
jgi:hypothetical protein